jgi:hypothetical protein
MKRILMAVWVLVGLLAALALARTSLTAANQDMSCHGQMMNIGGAINETGEGAVYTITVNCVAN